MKLWILVITLLVGCSSIPKDKQQHFAMGVVSSGIVFKFTGDTDKACIAATSVGLGKEVYDANHPKTHQVELNDFLATAAGCLVWKRMV